MYVNSVESNVTAGRIIRHPATAGRCISSSISTLPLRNSDCPLCGFSINSCIFVRVPWKFDNTFLGEFCGARTQTCSGVLWLPLLVCFANYARELH